MADDSDDSSDDSSDELSEDLSEEELELILNNPLELERVRTTLTAADTAISSGKEIDDGLAESIKPIIIDFLTHLLKHTGTHQLRSKESGEIVAFGLTALLGRVIRNRIGTTFFHPLIKAFVGKKSNIKIWKTVLQLVALAPQTTPPETEEPTYGSTPRKVNSKTVGSFDQTKEMIENALRGELSNYSYINVPGFFEKYFDAGKNAPKEKRNWVEKSKRIYKAVVSPNGLWKSFPTNMAEKNVSSWLSDFQKKHLADSHRWYFSTKNKEEMTGVNSENQLDLFVKSREGPDAPPYHWADVLVVGEHTSSPHQQKFLQLARYARNVFSAQPRRKFVHGFILSDRRMELHMFDRSGSYASEPIDIVKDPERFIRAMAGYCLMSDDELGLDTFIEREKKSARSKKKKKVGTNDVLPIFDETTKSYNRLHLHHLALVYTEAIMGRSTCCYMSTDYKTVIKFSWVSASRTPTEASLLKLAQERNVKGVPRLIAHGKITSTGELRSHLDFAKKRLLKDPRARNDPTEIATQSQKRKSNALSQSAPKRFRSERLRSKLSQVQVPGDSPDDSRTKPTPKANAEPFIDRRLLYHVTRPAGRPLQKFKSVSELLKALRDAIKAHRSLLLDGKILHRDISEGNIVITNPDENDGFHGCLIDLELGTIVTNGKNTRTELQRITGTLKYMAIEVIKLGLHGGRSDIEHTYRHDLESFFYVFLSICASYGWDKGDEPTVDPFMDWTVGNYRTISATKLGNMGAGGFESLILPMFSPKFNCLKELATQLRSVLFTDGDVYIGTPKGDENILYNKMINAFDKAINELKK